ncbi:MAG: MgtC/SapB family protein [Lachnospiraceae bacterium]|nr:MgtC/SapB family protein [Lachnospiraceae bacterium]
MQTFTEFISSNLSWQQNCVFVLRLLVASACGACIGLERSKRLKVAGIRTHILLCCAAALFMIVSKYGFSDLSSAEGVIFSGSRGADAGRIAAQVVSGISFLCAGVIFRKGATVSGLTTAVGLWGTAAIGLTVGAGMILLGICGTVILIVLQIVLHKFSIGNDAYFKNNVSFTVQNESDFSRTLDKWCDELGAEAADVSIDRDVGGYTKYGVVLLMKREVTLEDINKLLEKHPEITAVSSELM